jgi:isocitrate/isopropylmalate dehydrogenase
MSGTRGRLVILGGDGIGPEVMHETRRVIDWFASERGVAFDVAEAPFGLAAYARFGTLMPDDTMAAIMAADAILFGGARRPRLRGDPAGRGQGRRAPALASDARRLRQSAAALRHSGACRRLVA